jgi:hypothetical protein
VGWTARACQTLRKTASVQGVQCLELELPNSAGSSMIQQDPRAKCVGSPAICKGRTSGTSYPNGFCAWACYLGVFLTLVLWKRYPQPNSAKGLEF